MRLIIIINKIYKYMYTQNKTQIDYVLFKDSYYYLLRRYLESKFPGCSGREKYLDLIGNTEIIIIIIIIVIIITITTTNIDGVGIKTDL